MAVGQEAPLGGTGESGDVPIVHDPVTGEVVPVGYKPLRHPVIATKNGVKKIPGAVRTYDATKNAKAKIVEHHEARAEKRAYYNDIDPEADPQPTPEQKINILAIWVFVATIVASVVIIPGING